MAKPDPKPKSRRGAESDPAAQKRFGHNVAVLRVRRGMRAQQELANAAKVDVSTINDIENGKRNPGLSTIAAIARALGVSTDDLILDDAASRPRPTRLAADPEMGLHSSDRTSLATAHNAVGATQEALAIVVEVLQHLKSLPKPAIEQLRHASELLRPAS